MGVVGEGFGGGFGVALAGEVAGEFFFCDVAMKVVGKMSRIDGFAVLIEEGAREKVRALPGKGCRVVKLIGSDEMVDGFNLLVCRVTVLSFMVFDIEDVGDAIGNIANKAVGDKGCCSISYWRREGFYAVVLVGEGEGACVGKREGVEKVCGGFVGVVMIEGCLWKVRAGN